MGQCFLNQLLKVQHPEQPLFIHFQEMFTENTKQEFCFCSFTVNTNERTMFIQKL
jgi:hypothetical protein